MEPITTKKNFKLKPPKAFIHPKFPYILMVTLYGLSLLASLYLISFNEECEACTHCQFLDQLRNNFEKFLLIMSSDLTGCQNAEYNKILIWNSICKLTGKYKNIQNSWFTGEFYTVLQHWWWHVYGTTIIW